MRPIYITANSSTGDSQAAILDYLLAPANVMLSVELGGNTGGGASYTVYYSPDDPFATYVTSYLANANWYAHPTLTALAADGVDQLTVPARAVKLTTNTAGTGGTATPRMVVIQSGSTT